MKHHKSSERNNFRISTLWCLTAAIVIGGRVTVYAAIIPTDRLIDWSQSGVPGGIPPRNTIFIDVTQSPYNARGDDSTDNKAAIQAALTAAGAAATVNNPKVVYIPAGTYRVSGSLAVPSNITVRGAGIDVTIIKSTGSGMGTISLGVSGGGMQYNPTPYTTAISSGATAGSTSIIVASAAGISNGSHLVITELNDSSFVNITGAANYPGTGTWVDGWSDNGARARGQIVNVTNVSGTTLTITPALYTDYSHTPWATGYFAIGCQNSGVENLTVYATNTGAMVNFLMDSAVGCWLYNVKGDFTDGDHVHMDWSYRCEVRHCHFLDGFIHVAGSYDSGVFLRHKTTGCLVIDNIMERQHMSICAEWGAAGNVIAYNYTTGEYDDRYNAPFNARALMETFCASHGAHPQFNLFEGNISTDFVADSYWGTSSQVTALRNWFIGHASFQTPYSTRGTLSAPIALNQAQRAADVWEGQTSYSLIGNILGDATTTGAGTTAKITSPTSRSYDSRIYLLSLGYGSTSDGGGIAILPNPTATLIYHGNYNFKDAAQIWDPNIPDHTIPSSLFLSGKPTWFGSLTWPAFDPASPNPSVDAIPAGYRYVHGTEAPGIVPGQAPNNAKTRIQVQ